MRESLKRVVVAGLAAGLTLAWLSSHCSPPAREHPLAWLFPDAAEVPLTRDDSTLARAPWVSGDWDEAVTSPQFDADRRAFLSDLLRATKVSRARADSLATFAVREAYRRRVPPALVFGVLIAENETLQSRAASRMGAVGLMQVDEGVWVAALGHRFGTDLRDDRTNLRYGVFILGHYLHGVQNAASAEEALRRGLLRYNGCVRGTNTANCHRYPDQVRARIERFAIAQCGALGFERCVSEPLRLALLQTQAQAQAVGN